MPRGRGGAVQGDAARAASLSANPSKPLTACRNRASDDRRLEDRRDRERERSPAKSSPARRAGRFTMLRNTWKRLRCDRKLDRQSDRRRRQGVEMKTAREVRQVFAILRYDEFQDPGTPIENRVTVTRVVQDEARARSEVRRLNTLNGAKGCRYFCQATRLAESDS